VSLGSVAPRGSEVAQTYRSLPEQLPAVSLGSVAPRGSEVAHTYRSVPEQRAGAPLAPRELAPTVDSGSTVAAAKADANSAAFQVLIGLRPRSADVPILRVMWFISFALMAPRWSSGARSLRALALSLEPRAWRYIGTGPQFFGPPRQDESLVALGRGQKIGGSPRCSGGRPRSCSTRLVALVLWTVISITYRAGLRQQPRSRACRPASS
jgi:hypothetical protein